jgi:hypothetical protein
MAVEPTAKCHETVPGLTIRGRHLRLWHWGRPG